MSAERSTVGPLAEPVDVRVRETGGHAVVTDAWRGAPGAPTVFVYGHDDVQARAMADG